MNKKWKWGLSLASAAALLSGASIGLVACSDKNNNNNNQQNVEPEKQLYTPPEEVNIGDDLCFNLNVGNYSTQLIAPEDFEPELNWNGACIFQDQDPNSPTHNGWYTLLVNKTIQKDNLCANFIGWKYDTNNPKVIDNNFSIPKNVTIPNKQWHVLDKNGQQINVVPVEALFLTNSVSDWNKNVGGTDRSDLINSILKKRVYEDIAATTLDLSETSLEYVNIRASIKSEVKDLKIIFPSTLKMLENIDIIYEDLTNDVTTTLDFSRCQHSNITKRQKYPEKISVDFNTDEIKHNNTLTFNLPTDTAIYMNTNIIVNYNRHRDSQTQGIINLDNTENIEYITNSCFRRYSNLNSITKTDTMPNTLYLNQNCYYYEDSFSLARTTVHGGIEVSLDGYIVNPPTNNNQPQLQSNIKIDPIK